MDEELELVQLHNLPIGERRRIWRSSAVSLELLVGVRGGEDMEAGAGRPRGEEADKEEEEKDAAFSRRRHRRVQLNKLGASAGGGEGREVRKIGALAGGGERVGGVAGGREGDGGDGRRWGLERSD